MSPLLDRHGVAVAGGQHGGRGEASVEQSAALHDEAGLGGGLVGHTLRAPQTLSGSTGTGVQHAKERK